MLSICPYFHVHQPYRVKRYNIFDVGNDHNYFNENGDIDLNNRRIIKKVMQKSYLPANAVLRELLDKYPEFRFAFSFSGTVLDQFNEYAPEVLQSFQDLVASGRVELLSDTYYHSLAFFYSKSEFERQVEHHKKTIKRLFGQTPKIMRNTELSYNNDLAKWAENHGYVGIMAEGWDPVLGWRSPNFVYRPIGCNKIKVLLKNYKLSDDIAFRFGQRSWVEWPVNAEKYAQWIRSIHGNGETINLFMDYETFGEHQWEDTGIFDFLRHLPGELLAIPNTGFKTPTETIDTYDSVGTIDVPNVLTWADTERDLSAWVGNEIQQSALKGIYEIESKVLQSHDSKIIDDWRRLQTSDHFYYMCTKYFNDGDVHKYFNPYDTPYEAFITYMNALSDLKLRLETSKKNRRKKNLAKNEPAFC